MDVSDVAREVAELYQECYLRLYERRDPRAWRVSQETLMVLQHLAAAGPLTVTEAARHFDRSQAAVSELVARLVRRGLLARMADERDRRRHLVWLTREGHELLRRTFQVLSPELLAAALARMDGADRQRLLRGLRALREAADLAARERRGGCPTE
jgi:DNA-binding MarR family transcriptional regulator